jgi:hypothetical protein
LWRGKQLTLKVFSFPPGTAAFQHWDVRGAGENGRMASWRMDHFFNTTRSVILSNLKALGDWWGILIVRNHGSDH